MAERQKTARKQTARKPSARKPSARKQTARKTREAPREQNGGGDAGAVDEQELTRFLEERIKPGLNRGSIPMLARSIAREIAQEYGDEEPDDDDQQDAGDLEADLHELQRRLGSDWVLYFAVQDGESWLTAETEDAAQRLEASDASALMRAVKLLSSVSPRQGASVRPAGRPKRPASRG